MKPVEKCNCAERARRSAREKARRRRRAEERRLSGRGRTGGGGVAAAAAGAGGPTPSSYAAALYGQDSMRLPPPPLPPMPSALGLLASDPVFLVRIQISHASRLQPYTPYYIILYFLISILLLTSVFFFYLLSLFQNRTMRILSLPDKDVPEWIFYAHYVNLIYNHLVAFVIFFSFLVARADA